MSARRTVTTRLARDFSILDSCFSSILWYVLLSSGRDCKFCSCCIWDCSKSVPSESGWWYHSLRFRLSEEDDDDDVDVDVLVEVVDVVEEEEEEDVGVDMGAVGSISIAPFRY